MKQWIRKQTFKSWVCRLAVAALLLTSVSVGGAVSAESQSLTDVFTPYYTSSMKGAAAGTATYEQEAFTTHWAVNSAGRAQRNFDGCTWGDDVDSTMGVLYYHVRPYKNFDMTVEYATTSGYSDWVTFFGFGGEIGKSWQAEDNKGDTAFIIHAGGLFLNAKNKAWLNNGTAASDQTNAAQGSGTWKAAGVHTLRVQVNDRAYKLWIDGYLVCTGSNANYNGGYIYFAANAGSVQFGVPTVKELADTSVLSAYYVGNAKTTETMTAAALSDYWTVSDDMLVRNDRSVNWSNSYSDLSVVYLNTRKYKSFEMTVPYRVYQGSNHNNSTLIGFGATEMGKSFYFDDNAVACNISKYGAICSADTSAANYWYKASGTTLHDTVTGWDDLAAHTLTVRVVDGTVLYSIDGHTVFGQTLSSYTEDGYIFFASNELTTRFGVPTVRELTDTDTSGNADSPLYGKTALFAGDSISYGAGDDIFGLSWGGRIGIRYGMDWQNRSVSGSTVMETAGIPQIKNQLPDGTFDYVVLEGGINDALKSHPLGVISDSFAPEDFDTATFGGAFEELLYTARQKYPQAALGYIVTMSVPALADANAQPYYALAQEICAKWDVACLDLFADEEVRGWFADGAHLPDSLHPDAAGYELLTPKIAAWAETLTAVVCGDGNGDGVVDANDQAPLRRALLGLETPTWRLNANRDDRIDVRDLVSLAQAL